jgi:hypothetical protein
MSRTLVQWCAALVEATEQLPKTDALFDVDRSPSDPTKAPEVKAVVESLQRITTILQQRAVYDTEIFSESAGKLVRMLVGTAAVRKLFQKHEAVLCPLLEAYGEAEIDDCLCALAWLDTERSQSILAHIVTEQFSLREIEGHGRAIARIPLTSSHLGVLFPKLLTVFEHQHAKRLMWDACHLDTGRNIAYLAVQLINRKLIEPVACRVAVPELTELLNGSDRLSAPLSKDVQIVFSALVTRCGVTPTPAS